MVLDDKTAVVSFELKEIYRKNAKIGQPIGVIPSQWEMGAGKKGMYEKMLNTLNSKEHDGIRAVRVLGQSYFQYFYDVTRTFPFVEKYKLTENNVQVFAQLTKEQRTMYQIIPLVAGMIHKEEKVCKNYSISVFFVLCAIKTQNQN